MTDAEYFDDNDGVRKKFAKILFNYSAGDCERQVF